MSSFIQLGKRLVNTQTITEITPPYQGFFTIWFGAKQMSYKEEYYKKLVDFVLDKRDVLP